MILYMSATVPFHEYDNNNRLSDRPKTRSTDSREFILLASFRTAIATFASLSRQCMTFLTQKQPCLFCELLWRFDYGHMSALVKIVKSIAETLPKIFLPQEYI